DSTLMARRRLAPRSTSGLRVHGARPRSTALPSQPAATSAYTNRHTKSMSARPSKRLSGASGQRGINMFEVLVTLGIITIWLLATAGVQSSSAKLNKTAQLRTEAVLLASEIAERMESNSQTAVNGEYACDPCSLTDTPTGCVGSVCSGSLRAAFDKAEWGNR